ncbi:hypothetical protein C6A87_014075 [Mycobacterium sp. ITM-2016-00317]|uniref:hypothetical protein n=1 Tax=Mycobacterium sp. ITM-2016-00317 TaxID=2099694 RepID=UPI000D4151B6|nr:hypothetical protein [Mycobacterium sp. ITM-2016-00317]WNG90141.1 hypothetical protein C6A87_014075 [Mycobacterium sp. ITM-2016-00317]
MSSNSGPFGFDPEDLDRVVREAGEGLREAIDGLGRFLNTPGERAGWSTLFDTRPRTRPETTGETGDGVWAIYTIDDDGGAHIEQVYPTELDALRANKENTDPKRRVRFLPYGIAVSVLDSAAGGGENNPAAGAGDGSADQHP